jgi:chromosome segregation ATPase
MNNLLFESEIDQLRSLLESREIEVLALKQHASQQAKSIVRLEGLIRTYSDWIFTLEEEVRALKKGHTPLTIPPVTLARRGNGP